MNEPRPSWYIPPDATLEEELAIRERTTKRHRVDRIMRNAPIREARREAPPERPTERIQRPRERRAGRRARTRGPTDDSDPVPPPRGGDTRFQVALATAVKLRRTELAALADDIRIRLDWLDGGAA